MLSYRGTPTLFSWHKDNQTIILKQYLFSHYYPIHYLSSQGRTERNIAAILQIGKTTVDRDLVYLRKRAQENLKSHIQERLPEQYQKCMIGLNQVLKMGWDIVHNDFSTAANRLQALALINDSYKYVMDLTTNGVVVTDAIKYVQGQMNHLNKTEKALLQDIKQNEDKPEQEEDVEAAENYQWDFLDQSGNIFPGILIRII